MDDHEKTVKAGQKLVKTDNTFNPIRDNALRTAARFYPYRDDFSPKQIRVIWRALGIYRDLRDWAAEQKPS